MPKPVIAGLSNPLKRPKSITYFQPDQQQEHIAQWQQLGSEIISEDIWFRAVDSTRRVAAVYPRPIDRDYLPGRYRIEAFVPGTNATAIASFTILTSFDEQGQPIEENFFINQARFSDEWVALGEFELDITNPEIGRVTQFDDTSQTPPARGGTLEMAFGPLRWVPLYQTPEPLVTRVNAGEFLITNLTSDEQESRILDAGWSSIPNGSIEFRIGLRARVWGDAITRRGHPERRIRVDYRMPRPAGNGRYRIEAFIPAISRNLAEDVIYEVTALDPASGELRVHKVQVDQSTVRGRWVVLGELNLQIDPAGNPASTDRQGMVSIYDQAELGIKRFIAFGPLRWVPLFKLKFEATPGFDFPVGTEVQRAAPVVQRANPRIWLDDWHDASPFLEEYFLGLHTGADLNLSTGEDLMMPIFAAGDGEVIFAEKVPTGSWNYVIVIEHPAAVVTLPDGSKTVRKVYTRYGHVAKESLELVKTGEKVFRGMQIGFIGFMRDTETGKEMPDNIHLHFDISHSDIFVTNPTHWPPMKELAAKIRAKDTNSPEYKRLRSKTVDLVQNDYIDPFQFILDNHNTAPSANGDVQGRLKDADLHRKPGKERTVFDFPVGSQDQRRSLIGAELKLLKQDLFTGGSEKWYVRQTITAIGHPLGIQTGIDLNVANGKTGLQPVFAAADGTVLFSGPASLGPWDNGKTISGVVVVIQHGPARLRQEDGTLVSRPVMTRYAYLALQSAGMVQAGQTVQRGDLIGHFNYPPSTGVTGGRGQLHFDICHTGKLRDNPGFWPNLSAYATAIHRRPPASTASLSEKTAFKNMKTNALAESQAEVRKDFVDPLQVLIDNH